ncbi:MAG: 2-oxoacid:acceptor oxidoreductase subunit alpha [Rhodospirillaceae bacterium]|jgi:2-oxoglutarate/2-oxoacid ferredoxin oxidoreductase subunit alpha|nr:2-oxoacid:acceptor oxidoreductase subunit alpha [Rhodospirillaceae bacterium]MBT4220560.1 2-oxoacid:acceptor oxidoreductase subunit alpha [Rhodospirillaceae bacterium]MBT5309750.1 2-oxoacid:acceptor oxidoreductase subunit alpha [Rhodospirillaceae bacterium]MBT6406200.1 2-oxoacid:acceptor oxidoreductase subunit alpha [Rhodospirillaceae bacterium]MBT7356971.1 2-oxoacid:acceptor oxidoreductase subunit alpha [Rhodospirillaceae bacterium]
MAKASTKTNAQNLQGNNACALAAVAAGCRFYAGYPITPSSEVAERMSLELPKVDGTFIQMEDEIASMGAILGASMGGVKSMTATSGPGFSLKQENLGYGVIAEVPCVIINVMRGGPSTGMPTRPAQGDVMQARWGTHGDHQIIVISPASVSEVYEQTVRAFNLAEQFRTPVVLLIDEVIGHLVETVHVPDPASLDVVDRKWADVAADKYRPYEAGKDMVPAMARPGDGYRVHTTGLTHDESGFPTQDPETVDRVSKRLLNKFDPHRKVIDHFEELNVKDAEVLIVSYGISARAARGAVKQARDAGIKAGLFRPVTIWPFPEKALVKAAKKAKRILVAEMNAGQLSLEVERVLGRDRVSGVNRIDGEAISPADIIDAIGKGA